MNLVAIMPARNEEWILGLSLRAVLRWCDWAVVLNHASTDRTQEIINEVISETKRVTVATIDSPVWNEMDHRQYLLTIARQQGATHIAYVDADEVLTANCLPWIRQHCERLCPGQMLMLPWLQLRGSINRVHIGGVWGTQSASVVFLDDKRAGWAARNGYHFHQRQPMGLQWTPYEPIHKYRRNGGLMHLQMVSDRRLRAKQALYVMTERIRWPERPMPDYAATVYGYSSDGQFAEVPPEWWDAYSDILHHLQPEAEPWQAEECQKLWQEHGAQKFAGLDLFGVVG